MSGGVYSEEFVMRRKFISGYPDSTLATLAEAACDVTPVSGLTHNFYRYPARFSPKFVRAVIETLSEPGDLILDPFMGGGTTLVEALALGRSAIGSDISSLATFISEAKTTLYSEKELRTLRHWTRRTLKAIHMHDQGCRYPYTDEGGYQRHLHRRSTWRLRKAIEQTLGTAKNLQGPRLERLARCAILRTAQWALDGRKRLPSINEFRRALVFNTSEMIIGARQLRVMAEANRIRHGSFIHCFNRATKGLEEESLLSKIQKPKLVLTSPPYPGIHVLYHRWQVDGRKETPAPFWIAGKSDGSGAAYYTMGDRHARDLRTYFDNLRDALCSVAALCSRETIIIQVMAFSEPTWQLSRYLSVADDAGLNEFFLPVLDGIGDGRLWRQVPNRKWHADQKGFTHSSQEVVLFHKLRR